MSEGWQEVVYFLWTAAEGKKNLGVGPTAIAMFAKGVRTSPEPRATLKPPSPNAGRQITLNGKVVKRYYRKPGRLPVLAF